MVIKAFLSRQAESKGLSGALVSRPARPMAVWEQPVTSTFFMDYTGHCHSKLDDGGFLFMDQFGHCHSRLDDGGFLYMDLAGHSHTSLDDKAPQSSPLQAISYFRVHHPVPRSVANRPHEELVAMLGDLSVSQSSTRGEQVIAR